MPRRNVHLRSRLRPLPPIRVPKPGINFIDPQQLAAAFEPVIDRAIDKAKQELFQLINGGTISINLPTQPQAGRKLKHGKR